MKIVRYTSWFKSDNSHAESHLHKLEGSKKVERVVIDEARSALVAADRDLQDIEGDIARVCPPLRS